MPIRYANKDLQDGKVITKSEAWGMLLDAKGQEVVVKTILFENGGDFPSSVSVRGTLEIGPHQARVLVSDDVYSYFSVDDIVFIANRLSDDKLTIMLRRVV